MSNEIIISSAGTGLNLYTILRKYNGDTWNGTTWETFVDANINTYDIPLTSSAGDLWAADFPTAIETGQYILQFYERSGATPATTDDVLQTKYLYWTGVGLEMTPPAGLSVNALIDINTVKNLLGLNIDDTSTDNTLIFLINAASARIEKICSRLFKARNYKELIWSNWGKTVVLNNLPVIKISKLGSGAVNLFSIAQNTTLIRAQIVIESDQLTLISTESDGTESTSTYTFEDYPTTGLLVSVINSTGLGWSSNLILNKPSDELWERGGINCTAGIQYIEGIDESSMESTYQIALDVGALNLSDSFSRNIMCWYRAGFETIPEDLKLICGELVRILYSQIKDDIGILSISGNGDEKFDSVTYESVANLRQESKALLDSYKISHIAKSVF